MAIGRISGSVLKSNLTRNGVDLAFETNLLYIDVTNSRVGIGTSEPTTALQVNGTATTTGLNTTNLSIGGTAVTSTATELNVLDGTTLGAANELCVVDATGNFITTSSTLSIDQGNNYIGINQSSPEVTLHMTGEGAQTSQIRMEQYNDSADAPDVRTRRYRGTIASPSAVASGDYLFRSNHEYWNGSALIVGGTFAFDNTNNANRTQFAVSVTTDGTSADANTPSKTQFKIDGNDSGAITFNNAYKFPTSDGTANQVLATDGSGTVSFMDIDAVTSITFVGDDSTGTAVSTNETFKIAGTQNITTAVSGDTLTITGPDLTSYLTAETNDLTSAVTWANVPDANITQSSVTQHQASLSITESQISDLGSYITASSTDTLTNKSINLTNNTVSGTTAEFNTALSDGSFATLAGSETLTNKTLTTPVISSISNTGTLTLPTSSDTLVGRDTTDTLTNKTIDSASNTITITESNISDLGSYITASSTHTLTNKTFDANGTGNSISNIEVADFASGVVDTDLSSVSGSDDTLASAKAIKAYVDGEISSVSTTTISEGNSSVDVDDGAGGAGQVIINVDGNNELVVNDTSATFSGNVVVTGDLTVNGTTTTVATTNTTVTDSLVEYSNGTTGAPANDAGIVIERGDENNAFIGFDESEDKFIVGTGTFTGASTGNLTITTGTLVANLEGNVTGNVTGTVSDISNHLLDEDNMATDSATKAPSQQSVKAYVDAEDANIASDTLTFTNKTIDANGTGNSITNIDSGNFLSGFFLDEDNMASNDATAVASQQSIKAYVDAQVTAQDLDFQGDSGGALSIDLDSETLDIAGGTGIDTSGAGNTLTVAIDSTVATLAGTQTLTNKTLTAPTLTSPVLNTGVSGTAVLDEDNMATNSDTQLATQQSIKAYVDAEDANIASDTLTFTNKTFDANGTGNSLSNVEVADFASGEVLDEDNMASDSATKLATQQSIKAYVDTEIGNVSTTSISQLNTSATVSDTGSDGAFTVVADGNTELVVNDTSATFSGNVVVSGDFTVNGTTTTIDSTTLTVEDPLIQLAKNNSGGAANAFDQGLFFNRGSLDNVSFIWDESEDQFAFAVTSGEDGTTAGNITIDSYAALKAGVTTVSDLETGVISAADGTESATIANSTGVMTIASSVLTTTDINGGTVDGVTIGGASAGAGTFTNLTVNTDVDITDSGGDGTMDGVIIGGSTAAAGTFTTATATNVQATNIKANDGTAAIAIADSTGAVTISTAVELDGGNVTINESSASVDFRVESNGDTHALFVDGSEDHVGIKTSSPAYDLDISGSTDAINLPQGNTVARPTAAAGIIRFNTQTGQYEGCQDGSTYVNFAIAGDAPTFTKESTTGDGSTSTFSGFFSSAPESANNVFVYIDNVYQEPTENYTVSGTNITFTSAPHSGARIFAITGADNTALATGGIARSETSATSVSGSSAVNIMTFNAASYRSAELFITVQDSGNTQYSAMKATVIHDGTTAYGTTYAVTNSAAGDIVDISFNHDGSNTVEVKATPLNSGTQSIKVQYSLSSI